MKGGSVEYVIAVAALLLAIYVSVREHYIRVGVYAYVIKANARIRALEKAELRLNALWERVSALEEQVEALTHAPAVESDVPGFVTFPGEDPIMASFRNNLLRTPTAPREEVRNVEEGP